VLIGAIEAQLKQSVTLVPLFLVRWRDGESAADVTVFRTV
jgi:hypothetical protein